MHFENRHYVIFDMREAATIDFSEVMETSVETLRKSADESKSFIKFEGDTPASVTALNTRSQEYTYEEMLAILDEEEWAYPDPDPV